VVFVTHTARQARQLADHVVFLYLGELIEQGPTETIFTKASDPRMKAYIEGAFGWKRINQMPHTQIRGAAKSSCHGFDGRVILYTH
jgi:ABC-type glutathione transport system ATPase component